MGKHKHRKYAENDPLSDLHVSRWRRKRKDKGKGSDAGGQEPFDRDQVRGRTEVVAEEDLQ